MIMKAIRIKESFEIHGSRLSSQIQTNPTNARLPRSMKICEALNESLPLLL
jgi:hypothetical protein